MRYIQKFCLSRPITTIMFYTGLVLMGLIALTELEVNLLPELDFPRLTIVTALENASPEEIENLITRPITESIGTASNLKKSYSESIEGLSFITLQFDWGTNIDFSVMEIRERLDIIRGILPQDANRSIISRFDPANDPFMEIVFFAREIGQPRDLRHFIKNEVKTFLDRVDGVAYVQISGGYKKEIQIEVDLNALSSYKLKLRDIEERIAATNINIPAGHITVGTKDVLIRTFGEYQNLSDIEKTVIAHNPDGIPILLSSVAKIRDGYKDRRGMARYNGRECVVVSLRKESGKNTVNVAKNLRKELALLQKKYKNEIEFRIVYDESRFITQSIQNLVQSLLLGGILAFLALVLILRNLQSPAILVTVLPISILSTMLLMYIADLSLNMMTLGGLSLGIGMLFDAGNVVLSAIERHASAGLDSHEAALRGSQEVAGSITVAILTTTIVFLPIVFIENIVGIVFAEMALTITFSLLISLAVSLTLIPTLYTLGILKKYRNLSAYSIIQKAEKIEQKLILFYETTLKRILERPRKFIFSIFVLLVLSGLCFPFVRREFVPRMDTGELFVEVLHTRGTNLDTVGETLGHIEDTLTKYDKKIRVISRIGYDPDELLTLKGGDTGTHRGEIRAVLDSDRSYGTEDLLNKLRSELKLRDDIKISYRNSGDVITRILSPDIRPITLEFTGPDLKTLKTHGNQIVKDLTMIPGAYGLRSSMSEMGRELHVYADLYAMAETGASNYDIALYLNTAVQGRVVSKLRVSGEEIDLRLRLRKDDRRGLKDVQNMKVRIDNERQLYLSQMVRIKESKGHAAILRTGPERLNRITGETDPQHSRSVQKKVARYLENLNLPEGYSISVGGEKENIRDSFQSLGFVFLLAALLIYMLLSSQFESLSYSILMMATIPLILIGVLPSLLLSGRSLNISSLTGLILLVGVVVDNAALIFEYIHILQGEGQSLKQAVIGSGKIVLRPILMNNATTVLALFPIALELGEGTEFQSPMAITVISGLIASMLISLFLIPLLFYVAMRNRKFAQD